MTPLTAAQQGRKGLPFQTSTRILKTSALKRLAVLSCVWQPVGFKSQAFPGKQTDTAATLAVERRLGDLATWAATQGNGGTGGASRALVSSPTEKTRKSLAFEPYGLPSVAASSKKSAAGLKKSAGVTVASPEHGSHRLRVR